MLITQAHNTMRLRIDAALNTAATQNNIDILFACESGSRAWGFPSPDSDYDVRFIYKRQTNNYLSLFPETDQLVFPITEALDLYGWDIKKVLQLLYTSNCTPFEWLQSPIVYRENSLFREQMTELLSAYHAPRKQLFHYLGIANGALASMEGSGIKIKKLFYVLRPLLAAKWIASMHTYAPMHIEPLLDMAGSSLKTKIKDLIMIKAAVAESQLIYPDNEIMDFINNASQQLTAYATQLDKKDFKTTALEQYFRSCIQL